MPVVLQRFLALDSTGDEMNRCVDNDNGAPSTQVRSHSHIPIASAAVAPSPPATLSMKRRGGTGQRLRYPMPTTIVLQPVPIYAYTALKNPGPFPEGIQLENREKYLSPEEFSAVFGMSKSQWAMLPKWRQISKKKEVSLF